MLNDHVAREHPFRVLHQVLQQCVLFGCEFDALAPPLHLLRQSIEFQIPTVIVLDRFTGPRRSRALIRTSNSAKANGLVR